jgi:hypothetical protein
MLGKIRRNLSNLSDAEFVGSLRALLADFFWDCSELSLDEHGDSLSMRLAFVPEMPLDHTRVLFKGFEAMFNSRGYVATGSDVGPGFLSTTFKKVDQRPPPR